MCLFSEKLYKSIFIHGKAFYLTSAALGVCTRERSLARRIAHVNSYVRTAS